MVRNNAKAPVRFNDRAEVDEGVGLGAVSHPDIYGTARRPPGKIRECINKDDTDVYSTQIMREATRL